MCRRAGLPIGTGGSHRSRRSPLLLLVVVALLSLVAAACSTTSETSTAGADFVQRTPPTGAVDGTDTESDTAAPAASDAGDITEVPATSDEPTFADAPSSAVLTAVLERSEGLGFSFEQGFAMHMSLMGMEIDMAPTEPLARGHVVDDGMYTFMDLGVMMAELQAMDPTVDASMFDAAVMEMWTSGSVMTIDASSLGSVTDLGGGGDFPDTMLSGPVSIDLDRIEMGSADLTSLLAQGSQTLDPTAIADALRGLDSVTEVGTDVIDGRDVTVYAGTLDLGQYAAAMGQDLESQFGAMQGMGLGTGTEEMLEAMRPIIEAIEVEMTVMIDDDDLLRRLEVYLDMAPMFEAMFTDPELLTMMGGSAEEAEEMLGFMEALLQDVEFTMDMWMEFDGYGDTYVIDPPPATDITDEFSSAFAHLMVGA